MCIRDRTYPGRVNGRLTEVFPFPVTRKVMERGRERYDIIARYDRPFRETSEDLESILVPTPAGAQVPLSELATIAFAAGPPMIRSENARLPGWGFGDIAGHDQGGLGSEARRAVGAVQRAFREELQAGLVGHERPGHQLQRVIQLGRQTGSARLPRSPNDGLGERDDVGGQVAGAAWDALGGGAAQLRQEDMFGSLAESIGTTADALEDRLGTATKGLVDDAALIKGASDLISLGLADNEDKAVRLSAVMGALNWDMQVLTLTLANNSMMRLDALGLAMEDIKTRSEALKEAGMNADEAFDLADTYRTVVVILADGAIGQMMEPVELPEARPVRTEAERPAWALRGGAGRERRILTSLYLTPEGLERTNLRLQAKLAEIQKHEVRFEEDMTDDAEILLVAFGTMGRICKSSMRAARRLSLIHI